MKNEKSCLSCLAFEFSDVDSTRIGLSSPTREDLCAICYTSELGAEACVGLGCGHVFHANCVLQLLKHRWPTLQISFAFMKCPTCKQDIDKIHGSRDLMSELEKLKKMKTSIE